MFIDIQIWCNDILDIISLFSETADNLRCNKEKGISRKRLVLDIGNFQQNLHVITSRIQSYS